MAKHDNAIVHPRVANWIALVLLVCLLGATVALLLSEDAVQRESDDVTTVETTQRSMSEAGKTSSSTTTQKTTAPSAEPSTVERLASPTATTIVKSLLLFAAAFLVAGGIQRALLGQYAVKIAGVELPEVSEDTAQSIREAVQGLAEEPARTAPSDEAAVADQTAEPEPDNREPEEDVIVETPQATRGLVQLRSELERVVRALAVPPPLQDGSAISLVETLTRRGVLSQDLRTSLVGLLQAGDLAAQGYAVPEVVRRAAEQSGPYILETLAQRRRLTARSFEQHVLDILAREVPSAVVQEDVRLDSAQFDALVREDGNRVVVEVRSRLRPEQRSEVGRLLHLVAALPPDLPVVLVVAGAGLTAQQEQELQQGRQGKVYVVRWDEEYAIFGQILRDALSHSIQG